MKFKRAFTLIMIGISVPLGLCFCLWVLIVIHDFRSPQWESDLSSLRGYKDVQATLESNLVIGQSTRDDVLSFLEQQRALNKCYQTDEGIFCWIPTRLPILRGDNPLDLRDMRFYNLWTKYSYRLTFRFSNHQLDKIEVSEHGTGL